MAVHKWRRRETKHFGNVWVPFAQIELQAAGGEFQEFLVQVDSGAVVSLLRRSAATLLGLDIEKGRQVSLGSVGGVQTIAYVHELKTRFAANIIYPVPFAIAVKENVPNLLGRLNVFDWLQVDFDGTVEETRIAPSWLDPPGRRIWEFLVATEHHVIDRWRATKNNFPENVRRATTYFLNRSAQILASARALIKLDGCYGAPNLICTMFELTLQFEYILSDPVTNAERYLEFANITRYRKYKAIAENPTGIVSNLIASSPRRAEIEKRTKIEYDRVRPKYLKQTGKLASNWYDVPLAELAKKLGRDGEYRIVYALCSDWAHGDPTSLEQDPSKDEFCNPKTVLLVCCGYHARILLMIADFGKLVLASEQYDRLRTLAAGIS